MRTLFKTVVVLGVIGGVAWALVPHLPDHFRAARQEVSQEVIESSGYAHLERLIKNEIKSQAAEVAKLHGVVFRQGKAIETLTKRIAASKQALAREEEIIGKAKLLLTERKPGDVIKIGLNDYTFTQLEKDAVSHVAHCKRLRAQAQDDAQLLATLVSHKRTGEVKLAEATRNLEQARRKLEEMQAKKERLLAAKKAIDIASAVADFDVFSDSKLAEWFQAYSERVAGLEASVAYRSGDPAVAQVVDWQEPQGAVEAIDEYFDKGAKKADTKTALTSATR